MSQVFALGGRMNVGCWKRQCCFQQPHDCILTPVRQFLPISRLYMADFESWHEAFRLYMALVLGDKVTSGVKICPLSHLVIEASAIYKRDVSGRTVESAIYKADSADQLNPTTCSATKYPLRITKRPIDPRKFNARDMAFLRTSL